MKCIKIEKWLSDMIDGELPEKKRRMVGDHLQKCSLCRAYRQKLERIQNEAKKFDYGKVAPHYWEEFPSRIKARISSLRPRPKQSLPFAWNWRWAWVGAATILVILIGLYMLYFQARVTQEVYIFSFEDSIAQVFYEIGTNSELADIFNTVILESIGESLGETEGEIIPDVEGLFFLEEELTEEELMDLDLEIKKEIES